MSDLANWWDLLDQDDAWIDADGIEHVVADMDPGYCRRVLIWLYRNADYIANEAAAALDQAPLPDVDTAAYDLVAFSTETDDMRADPHTWLVTTPLITSLRTRAGWLPLPARRPPTMTTNGVLSTSASRNRISGQVTITFAQVTRQDPLAPYIDADEIDGAEAGYHPGGQRHSAAALILPAVARRPYGSYPLALKFSSPEAVDDLITHLTKVREQLAEKFPADLWDEPDTLVTVHDGHLVCPACTASDTIVEHEIATRINKPIRWANGAFESQSVSDLGNFNTDHYRCKACGSRVDMPSDIPFNDVATATV
ncbi:hypothetical protein [Nonomuraea dietziae]|uniref:hypothetical protein n=1 Tax=Nonomuraea dietziae TaxID=65515 RepID=UPI0033EA7F76